MFCFFHFSLHSFVFFLYAKFSFSLAVKYRERHQPAGGSDLKTIDSLPANNCGVELDLWYSPPASMMSRLASVTFKMANKVFIEETDKNFDFITEILFRFLRFGDFKVPIVIDN